MAHRRRLPLSSHAKTQLLEQLRTCREQMIDVIRTVPIGGPEATAANQVKDAIDDFAAVLTGDRQHFWLPLAPSRDV
jgi:hypothetical protein